MSASDFIGIDCGGTHCRVAWQGMVNRVDFFGAGANFTSDPVGCTNAITEACQSLSDKAGISLATVFEARVYLGVAGIVTEEDSKTLLSNLPFTDAVAEDDRRALAVGTLGDRDGYIASLGTGSFFLHREGDQLRGIGGWGLTLGDEASGAWLGRSLLRMALQAQDGLVPHSALTKVILDEFGGPAEVVGFAQDASPAEYARLAPGLIAAANEGDRAGRSIMQRGGTWISKAVTHLGWTSPEALCLPGKLGQAYAPYLPDVMRDALQNPLGSGVDGALMLAQART